MQACHNRPHPAFTASWSRLAAALLAIFFGGTAGAVGAAPMPARPPLVAAADFGSPPSGEVPIVFNDHTIYARPDTLKAGRVLAALVKGGQIFVPLRSMFEAMGATVSASAGGKTVLAEKPGASVSVTVGKNEVSINGEPRPLDVAPMLYKGIVLVPVRVLSEALGAYVQWIPNRRVVAVRYLATPAPTLAPATPAPTPTPTAPPPPAVTPTPTETPAERTYQGFIQAAAYAPSNYNEFSAAQWCSESYLIGAGYAFKNSPFAVKVDFRQYVYVTSDNFSDAYNNHYTQFATIDRGIASTYVFKARQSSLDARLEFKVASPRVYVGVGFLQTANNYGYPQLTAVGAGIEKLPDLTPGINVFGSFFYYPSAGGNYTITSPASSNFGTTYRQQYQVAKFDIGLALVLKRFPVYAYGGFNGEHYGAKSNAPIGQTHDGPYIGLGVKL